MVVGSINVAVAQVAGTPDIARNMRCVGDMIATAAQRGSDLVLFPEAVMYDFTASGEDIAAAAAQADDFESHITDLAIAHKIAVVAGIYQPGAGPLARNMLVACGPDGKSLGQYQKLHLYDAFEYRESRKSERAQLKADFAELTTFNLGGFTFGLLNCYDLRFPEIARALVDRGADILLVCAAWVAGPRKAFHWETLLKARAIENTCFIAAACQPPPASVGLSMVLDTNGVPVSVVPDGDGLAFATLEAYRLTSTRKILPCLEHRRYGLTQLV